MQKICQYQTCTKKTKWIQEQNKYICISIVKPLKIRLEHTNTSESLWTEKLKSRKNRQKICWKTKPDPKFKRSKFIEKQETARQSEIQWQNKVLPQMAPNALSTVSDRRTQTAVHVKYVLKGHWIMKIHIYRCLRIKTCLEHNKAPKISTYNYLSPQ